MPIIAITTKSSINEKLNKQINYERKAKPKDAIIITYFLNIIKW